MKFFIEDQQLKDETDQILAKIRLRMNGTTVGQMEDRGIKYRINYGVGFPHLKELSGSLRSNYGLAERLWFMEIRETMLLAAMLVPIEEMTEKRSQDWSKIIDNIDLVERSSMLLWGKLPFADQLIKEWQSTENRWMNILANYTLGWHIQNEGVCSTDTIDSLLDKELPKDDYLYLKSVSFLWRKMIRVTGKSTSKLNQWVKDAMVSDHKQLKILAQELLSEIRFLENDF